ncbi:MAG: hypothetical protein DYG90_10965 [Chloroflexi bacterium CFX6]|nr:hypothetical protein [Chloroflexi bacterium CFX6]
MVPALKPGYAFCGVHWLATPLRKMRPLIVPNAVREPGDGGGGAEPIDAAGTRSGSHSRQAGHVPPCCTACTPSASAALVAPSGSASAAGTTQSVDRAGSVRM